MNRALLLCALSRHGKPAEAAELLDTANALAMDAGWPPRTWKGSTTKEAAALLKGMASRGEVTRFPGRPSNGREVAQWGLQIYDSCCPMPPAPDPEGEDHPLYGMTSRQKFVLFDVLDSALATHARMQAETHDLLMRHARELADLAGRAKRDLLSAGIEVGA